MLCALCFALSFSDAKNAASDKIQDGLTSPVRAQVDAALGKASAELKSKMASVEEELRAKASRLDEEFSRKQQELQAQYEAKKAEVDASIEARIGPLKAKLTAEFEAKRAELEASIDARIAPIKAKLIAEFEAKKNELRDRALHEFELILVKTLDEKVLPAIQKAALDPLMPLFVQKIVVDAIAASWPDIKEEIFDLWSGLVLKFAPVDDPPFIRYWPNPFRAAMHSWLYHTFPYDRNFWWQIRRPMWWFWNIVALCPFYGVQALYFILLFLMLDKRDEYQMVNFILQFKVREGLERDTLQQLDPRCSNHEQRRWFCECRVRRAAALTCTLFFCLCVCACVCAWHPGSSIRDAGCAELHGWFRELLRLRRCELGVRRHWLGNPIAGFRGWDSTLFPRLRYTGSRRLAWILH